MQPATPTLTCPKRQHFERVTQVYSALFQFLPLVRESQRCHAAPKPVDADFMEDRAQLELFVGAEAVRLVDVEAAQLAGNVKPPVVVR